MSQSQNGDSGALGAAGKRRVELKQAVSDAEAALASPAGQTGWRDRLLDQLRELMRALDQHIEEVEAPDGLLAELEAAQPRLTNQISRVRDEHPALRRQMENTIECVTTGSGVGDVRTAVLATISEVARHRQHGADLVWEGYSVDIGGS